MPSYLLAAKDKNSHNRAYEVKSDKSNVNFPGDSTAIYFTGFTLQCFFVDSDYGMEEIFFKRFYMLCAVFLEYGKVHCLGFKLKIEHIYVLYGIPYLYPFHLYLLHSR